MPAVALRTVLEALEEDHGALYNIRDLFSNAQLVAFAAQLNTRLYDAETYASQLLGQRDAAVLPTHINVVANLYFEVEELADYIPENLFNVWRHRLTHLSETLTSFQNALHTLVDGQPERAVLSYERLDVGGGSRIAIDEDVLRMLVRAGWTDEELARFFQCDRKTVLRRRGRLAIVKNSWTPLTVPELVPYLADVRRMGGGLEGEKGLASGLLQLGICVPRSRLRAAMSLLPPLREAGRAVPIIRRVYRVPWINSLWHIDGHHKLIRWKFVIHGGIDGFSRTCTFMRASDNNRAETMMSAFMESEAEYGVPSRVRADNGRENWDVKDHMERFRGFDRGSFIQGPSTHNQRIERLWVDLQRWCTGRYYKLFTRLEFEGKLDVENPVDMFALHYCYLPMLNAALDFWRARWNCHKIRTAGNKSPAQLWNRNLVEATQLGINPIDHLDDDKDDPDFVFHQRFQFANYGVEEFNRRRREPMGDDPLVEVEPVLAGRFDLWDVFQQPDLMAELARAAGPAWPPADDEGVGRYVAVQGVLEDWID